jgi:hypothetical protein
MTSACSTKTTVVFETILMATCYKCGGEIEFYHNGFNAVPLHLSGSCSGSNGSSGYGGSSHWVERETESGQRFAFNWVAYLSYVNPNAHCPVCGADVYFYQSPYGGRVFFDELGPPWPKHPCTSGDDFSVRRIVQDFQFEDLFPKSDQQHSETNASKIDSVHESKPVATAETEKTNYEIPEWQKAGWNPLLLTKAEPGGNGIVIEGNELRGDSKIEFKFQQINIQDTFQEKRDNLIFSFSMIMNPRRLISALIENVVFIRKISETVFEFSTVVITKDNEMIHFTFQMKLFSP